VSARARLLLGVVGIAATASVVRRDRVGPREARAFRAVNALPDELRGPLWVGMQAGALGAVPVAAGAARLAGRERLPGRLLVTGTAAWLLAKAVKPCAGRPRPLALIPDARCRGPEATGLGYVSGHAAVVVALVSAALPHLGRRGRAVALGLPAVVGLSRLYVGAHLPLDVAGGAALGLAVDAAVSLVGDAARRAQAST
jgi:glycosyltransferase 2 family protein